MRNPIDYFSSWNVARRIPGKQAKRRKILCLSVIVLSAAVAHPQEHAGKAGAGAIAQKPCTVGADESAIRQIGEQWKKGYNDGDAAKVAALYADGAYYLTQHFITGMVHGRAGIRAYVQRGVDAGYHIDSIQIISVHCSGDLAYTVGKYESTNAGQKAFGVNLVVLKKAGSRWLIVAHESAVPDPATAIRQLESSPGPPPSAP